jgi:soluble cytochrome b562
MIAVLSVVSGKGAVMKLQTILIFGFILVATACAKKEQGPALSGEEMPMAAPDAAVSIAESGIWENESFVAHMHEHAEKLDELNFALSDGDLEAAKASAHWLSTHDTNSDIQADWMPYLYRMRSEAEAVEAAADIETATAAAQRITAQCQDCHASAGIRTQ